MQELAKKGGKHVVALLIFLGICVVYFAPAVLDGKMIRQSDMEKAAGAGGQQMKKFEETAAPGEFSAWSDAMFGGMPYVAGYGNPAPELPGFRLLEKPLKAIGDLNAGMVFAGLVCFYILMCVMGVNWWLAIAGAIAFAFATYNIVIIEVGHITKAYVMAFMPITLAGMWLLFKRRLLWGGILFLLGVALSVANNHPQITYYLMLLCLPIYIGYVVKRIKQKELGEVGRVTAIMAICVLIAVLPNAKTLYAHWDLGKHSTRGATELTTTTPSGEKISSGLDKDYAFQWSYGKGELLTLMIPNAFGGSSATTVDSSSNFIKTLRSAGYQVGNEMQAPTFWGDKPMTSGPVYIGAVICFLFLFGMFVIRRKAKWWWFGGAVLLTLMALGRNFDTFNTFLFHYLPLYNKFRTVEMALVIPSMVAVVLGMWGLRDVVKEKVEAGLLRRGLIWSTAVTGGICLIVWLMPTALLSFQSEYDTLAGYVSQPWYDALLLDRQAMASSDAFRSLIFILLTAGLIFFYMKMKDKTKASVVLCAGVAVLILVDLWPIDRRYLNDGNYITKSPNQVYTLTNADKVILEDTDPSFRVATLNNPFQETTVSYYHHSIGGYHAAKLRRYQELIDRRMNKEINAIIQSFQSAKSFEDIAKTFQQTPSLNMLNARYIIYSPEQQPIYNPYAFGNAWFVSDLEIVENADAEIETLERIDPYHTAVVDRRFAAELERYTPAHDSTAIIALDAYRPNKLTYLSKASTEQLAVFSEIYYQPGWHATIDGEPVSHFRANWLLRAMLVPAGEHRIEFEFRPEGYIRAAWISSISSFLILLLIVAAIGYSGWKAYKS